MLLDDDQKSFVPLWFHFRGKMLFLLVTTNVKSGACSLQTTVAPAAHDVSANWDNAKSGRLCLRKRKRLKCAHPGREMLLIYCISPKVTELWKSGLCGCCRLTLTQLSCPFISFKKSAAPAVRLTECQCSSKRWKWRNIAVILWLHRGDTDLTLNKWALSLSPAHIIGLVCTLCTVLLKLPCDSGCN